MRLLSYTSFIAFAGGLSGLLLGLDTGVIAGALPLIKIDWHVTSPVVLGLIVSILLLGALIGAVIGGPISKRLGRKFVILVAAVIFTVCAVLSGFAPNVSFLIVTRFFLGIALGLASFITPIYLSEISSSKRRGAVVSIYQLMITVGLLMAFALDTYFSSTANWRLMLSSVALPAAMMFVFALFLPKSPRWLVMQGREKEAKAVLFKVFGEIHLDKKLQQITTSFHQQTSLRGHQFKKVFFRLVFLGFILQMLQQWTGINAIMYYAPSVFKAAGFTTLNEQMWCTVAVGVVNVLTTILAIFCIDRLGRRPILMVGLFIMLVALGVIAYVLNAATPSLHALSVGAVLLYIFGFAVSLGPIVWLLCSEIFPLSMRDTGVVFTTVSNWACNFILSQNFPWLVEKLSISHVFIIFFIMCIVGLLLVYFLVPETKGVSLEVIESNVLAGRPLCQLASNELLE